MNQWEHDEERVNGVPAPVGTIVATSAATAVNAEQPATVVPPAAEPSLKDKLMAELHKLEEEVLGVKQ
jgi:hypothetical protein